jgi:hypothetical protein
MVHYWKLDEEAGATTFEDCYGVLDAACAGSGCPNALTGQVNGAQDFDGAQDQLLTADESNPTAITVVAWARPDDLDGADKGIISKAGAFLFEIETSGDRISFAPYVDGSLAGECDSEAFAVGTWTHVAGTWDGQVAKIYADGELLKTCDFTDGPLDSPSGPYYIANSSYDLVNRHFDGSIDEVAVFDQALGDEEIEDLYEKGVAAYGYCEGVKPVAWPNAVAMRWALA